MNKDLLTALLSLDAYNRGYNVGIEGVAGAAVGSATFLAQSQVGTTDPEFQASFYAVAYRIDSGENAGTYIVYRGTDNLLIGDPVHGWPLGGGNPTAEQAKLAEDFFRAVVGEGNAYDSGVTLTGHSLGGGLAGFVASLYGREAEIFDSMNFENAAGFVEAARQFAKTGDTGTTVPVH